MPIDGKESSLVRSPKTHSLRQRSGRDGSDTVDNGLDGTNEQHFRSYQTVLSRAPDKSGGAVDIRLNRCRLPSRPMGRSQRKRMVTGLLKR